ncbi:hypothetical protein GOE03_29785 [Sinorhizobium medicae]|nr:hypothetical protein [Sinorhizobium medicae]
MSTVPVCGFRSSTPTSALCAIVWARARFRGVPVSFDVDLTYLPIQDRETTLKNIDTILEHIREDLPRDFCVV